MKNLKIFIILALLVSGIFTKAAAQNTVKGVVQDRETLEPIPGVTIGIPNNDALTTTDNNGRFEISSNNAFDSITVKFIGYKPLTVYADKAQPVSVLLQFDNTLKTVEITGIKPGRPVTSLTEAELNRGSGLNLDEALNTVPGVTMQSRTPWGGQHIVMRGYYPSADNGRTNAENFNGLGYQLFINNIPVTDAIGTTVMDDIDFSTLGRVDIMKGPSPLYGSYIAGAVNLYTEKPVQNQNSINEQFIAGSYGLIRSNTTLMTSDGKSDIWINYGHQNYNGFRPHDASAKDFISAAADFHSNSKNTISTYFSYNHSNEQLAGEIDSSDFYARKAVSNDFYVANNSHVDIQSFRTGITDKYQFSSHFSNQTTVFATGYNLSQYFAHGFNQNNEISSGARTAFNYMGHAGSVSISGTLGAMVQSSAQTLQGNFIPPVKTPPFTPTTTPMSFSDAHNTAMNTNVFTQWSFTLPSQWALILGASYNSNTFATQNLVYKGSSSSYLYLDNPVFSRTFDPAINPSATISKTFNSHISMYASASAGYAPPTISQMLNTAGQVDTHLNPEKAMVYELGSRGSLGEGNRFNYQVAVYDMNITDRLTQITENAISYYTNVGAQQNMGAELSLSYNVIDNPGNTISLVRPWVTYTYSNDVYSDFKNHTKTKTNLDTVSADYSGNHVAGIAPNVFNAGVDVATRFGLYLSAVYNYTDKVPVTFDNYHYMNSFTLLNAKLGYKHDFGKHFSLDVFAGANNLLGSTCYSFIFLGQNIAELGQATDTYIKGGGDGYILPAPYGATFYGGAALKYKF